MYGYNNYYIIRAKALEEIANFFISEHKLKINFDVIELLNLLGIDVLSSSNLPPYWEYAFNIEEGKLKIFYDENLLNNNSVKKEEINLDYNKRNLRFILTHALADILLFYRLEDNNLIKKEYNGKIYCKGTKKYFSHADKECEYLAAALLMPRQVLEEKFYDLLLAKNYCIAHEDLKELGMLFGVNLTTIRQRCKVLGLIKT